jgi:hypothetical protein
MTFLEIILQPTHIAISATIISLSSFAFSYYTRYKLQKDNNISKKEIEEMKIKQGYNVSTEMNKHLSKYNVFNNIIIGVSSFVSSLDINRTVTPESITNFHNFRHSTLFSLVVIGNQKLVNEHHSLMKHISDIILDDKKILTKEEWSKSRNEIFKLLNEMRNELNIENTNNTYIKYPNED